MTPDTTDLPRPSAVRRVWISGLQYDNETTEQMIDRQNRYRAEDRRIEAELDRLWKWKCRPWWEEPR